MAIGQNNVNEKTAGYFYLTVNKNKLLFFESTHQRTYFECLLLYFNRLCIVYIKEIKKNKNFYGWSFDYFIDT